MKSKVFITIVAVAAAAFFSACGGAANTSTNSVKPGNANTAASNAPSNSGANTNSAASNAATAQANGAAQDFTLVNKTGVVIDQLFVSPADKDEWGEDILGQDQLTDNQSVDIKFHPKEKAEKWDLKVQDTQGNSIEWNDLKLTEINKVTLHYKDGKGTAEVE
jgi:hypothetical protein